MTQLDVRLWTVNEYHRMAEEEILSCGERVELIAGQIILNEKLWVKRLHLFKHSTLMPSL